jgi:hypothetical protein
MIRLFKESDIPVFYHALKLFATHSGAKTYVYDDGEAKGFIIWDSQNTKIMGIYVLKQHRYSGIGRELVTKTIRDLGITRATATIEISPSNKMPFCEACGFDYIRDQNGNIQPREMQTRSGIKVVADIEYKEK